MIASLERRARTYRSRMLIRAWDYRQRDHARGVWLRLRRVLADASHAYIVSGPDADRLRRGQPVLLRGRDAPVVVGAVYAIARGTLVALGEVERGELKPKRIFNLPPRSAGGQKRDA